MDNQRIRLSKTLLRSSLINLLTTKSINKITIKEICDNAQINRTTFYKYYGSQYDLMIDIENEILKNVENCLEESGDITTLSRLLKMLAFLNENAEICRVLMNNNVDPRFPEKLMNLSIIRQIVINSLEKKYNSDEINYVYGLIVNGGFDIIRKWINKEQRESTMQLANFIEGTIMKLI